jgi:hypothetical protein
MYQFPRSTACVFQITCIPKRVCKSTHKLTEHAKDLIETGSKHDQKRVQNMIKKEIKESEIKSLDY